MLRGFSGEVAPMRQPPPAELLTTFSVEPFGGSIVRLADVDGQEEMLIPRCPGQFKSQLYADRDDVTEQDQKLHYAGPQHAARGGRAQAREPA